MLLQLLLLHCCLLCCVLLMSCCLQREKTAAQQKLQAVEELVQLHAQLQELLQNHATSPATQVFPADAVGHLLQCHHLAH